MAVIQAVVTNESKLDGSVKKIVWSTLIQGSEDGSKFSFVEWSGLTVQVSGTWDGATCTMQGSNDAATWFTLTDSNGVALSGIADYGSDIEESYLYVRPLVSSAGGSTDLDVTLIGHRTTGMRT